MLYLVLTLGTGLGLVFAAVFTAIAAVYLSDSGAEVAAARAPAARRRVWVDPNEAARAVGSWAEAPPRPAASAQASGSSPASALAVSAVRTAASTVAENSGSLSARATMASIISVTRSASMVSMRVPPASR